MGIIGLTGSGKTTIADLITKVIRPRQGNVLINNCDINKLNTYYLRDIVTYVPENFQLIDATIEENVIYIADPMLEEYKDLSLGWYYGTKEVSYLECISDIIKKIFLQPFTVWD